MGHGQCCAEERGVPFRVHLAFLQQKECYPGGQRQVNHLVLQQEA
jgi:hypothetical protein